MNPELTPLTESEYEQYAIPESYHGFAYWDSEGYLITMHMHKGIIDMLAGLNH